MQHQFHTQDEEKGKDQGLPDQLSYSGIGRYIEESIYQEISAFGIGLPVF